MSHLTVPADTGQRIYIASAAQTVFSVPFPFYAPTDLVVYVNGALVAPADYVVAGSAVDGGYQSGTVTFGAGRTASDLVAIVRETAIVRTSDFPYPSQTLDIRALNTELDRLTLAQQEKERQRLGSLRIQQSEEEIGELPLKADRALMSLGFNANGDPVAFTPDAGSLVVTAFMQSVLASTDALTARQGLGIVWAGTFGGTANALTGSVLPIVVARQASQIVRGLVGTTNTATNPTLVLNGLASGAIKAADGNPIWPGALRAGCVADFLDDGTNYRLLNPALPLAVDASLAASQSIPASTSTALVMGAPGKDDIGAFAGGSPSRLTMAVAGRVRVTASVNWGSGTTASHILEIWKNGVSTGFTSTLPTNAAVGQNVSAEFEVAAADYIQAIVFQDTAGALSATSAKIALAVVR